MVQARRRAQRGRRRGEAALEGGEIRPVQQIDLGMVLLMDEAIGAGHARGEILRIAHPVQPLPIGVSAGGEIGLAQASLAGAGCACSNSPMPVP